MTNRPLRLALGLPTIASTLAASVLAPSLLAGALLLAAPSSTFASCALPPPIDNPVATADIVFVGTVSATSNGNRWATVAVQEVWRGPDMPATVVIQGGPAGNAATSVDRSFQVGTTYLFFPNVDSGTGALTDNSCSSTTEFTEDMAKLRPATVRQPLGSEPTAGGGFDIESLLPVGVAVLVFGALLAVGLLARGRQET